MIEVSEIRRRLRQTMEQVKRANVEKRAQQDAAARAFETFLADTLTPVARMFTGALKAEGYPFTVFTPAGGLRLMSERSNDDFIEFFLDASAEPPSVAARTNRGRGHRVVTSERAIRDGATVEQLTEEDVLNFLLEEIMPFLER